MRRLLAVLLAAAVAAAPALAVVVDAEMPPDVAARWSTLDPTKWSLPQLQSALPLLRPPPGFAVGLYYNASLVDNARSLAVSGASKHPGGPIISYVSSTKANKTYALVDSDGDGSADSLTVVLDGLDTPQGMDWHDGDLYVTGWDEAGRGMVWRARGIDSYALAGRRFPNSKLEVVTNRLPSARWHGARYARFSPDDGLLYVSVGAPCNVCPEDRSPQGIVYSTIYTINTTNGDLNLFARGLRNVVGMDWHPDRPSQLFFTDHGRDSMGDDLPDDKLQMAPARGEFYGFPACHTNGSGDPYLRSAGQGSPLPDPGLNGGGQQLNCSDARTYRRPVQALGPHVAPLGLRFYRQEVGKSWPSAYDRALIIAEHGSWDRSSKIGYRLVTIRLADAGATDGDPPVVTQHEEFLTGFVGGPRGAPKDKQVSWGRPADVQQLPDGSLLISDDGAHTVYRLHYVGNGAAAESDVAADSDGGADQARSGAVAAVLATAPPPAAKSGQRETRAGGGLWMALVGALALLVAAAAA